MIHAIKQRVIVQTDGLIQIRVPELKAGTSAEVIILEEPEQIHKSSLSSIIGKGQGSFASAEEADAFLSKERELWD